MAAGLLSVRPGRYAWSKPYLTSQLQCENAGQILDNSSKAPYLPLPCEGISYEASVCRKQKHKSRQSVPAHHPPSPIHRAATGPPIRACPAALFWPFTSTRHRRGAAETPRGPAQFPPLTQRSQPWPSQRGARQTGTFIRRSLACPHFEKNDEEPAASPESFRLPRSR